MFIITRRILYNASKSSVISKKHFIIFKLLVTKYYFVLFGVITMWYLPYKSFIIWIKIVFQNMDNTICQLSDICHAPVWYPFIHKKNICFNKDLTFCSKCQYSIFFQKKKKITNCFYFIKKTLVQLMFEWILT